MNLSRMTIAARARKLKGMKLSSVELLEQLAGIQIVGDFAEHAAANIASMLETDYGIKVERSQSGLWRIL